MTLKRDPEFAGLIPPLTDDELQQLEENLLSEGCRDALIVWGDILIDGHNRLKICEKHSIPYETIEREFEDRDDAMRYIIKNQVGRRNLPPGKRVLLSVKLESLYKPMAKDNQRLSKGRGQKGLVNLPNLFVPVNVREEVAKIAGVSASTIGKGKKIVEEGTSEQIERVSRGGKGNSVYAVYKEVQNAQKTSSDEPIVDEQPMPIKDSLSKRAGSEKPSNDDLAKIRSYVAELKDPDVDRSFTPEKFLAQYAAFAERFIRSLGNFLGEPYSALYPQLKARERKQLIVFNEAIIEAVQKNIDKCEESHHEKTS